MAKRQTPMMRALFSGVALTIFSTLSGCSNLDFDLRNNFGNAPNTSGAARQATAPRPPADDRGVISYPNYQVAVARRGDTLTSVANRLGLDPAELARYNGMSPDTQLRPDEIIALPRRVTEPSPATGAVTSGPLQPEPVDITTLAGGAIERAGSKPANANANIPSGVEPIRHKVERGETAYSISRLYNVSVRSLAEWNGLGNNLTVREGQYLLIPVARNSPPANDDVTPPGAGTPVPVPPSSTKPLPAEKPAAAKPATPPSPNLGGGKPAAASNARLLFPVQGNIIRAYSSKSDGIDIAAKPGTSVIAADNGTVAAITRDTDQVPILVIRHKGNLLTIYANIDKITVKKGDRVRRGQAIAKVRAANPAFVHFEVRKDFDSVDPMPYLE
ncbi:peptidoglycan DD-metalloendopeptidase family protein [Profundibacter sp.]